MTYPWLLIGANGYTIASFVYHADALAYQATGNYPGSYVRYSV